MVIMGDFIRTRINTGVGSVRHERFLIQSVQKPEWLVSYQVAGFVIMVRQYP
jgi:hypothetical protein